MDEKLGGLPSTADEAVDFQQCISSCIISKLLTKGSTFTWGNGRIEEECIFERLDRVLVNQDF